MSRTRFSFTRMLAAGSLAGLLAISLSACGGNVAASSESSCTPAHKDLKTVTEGELTVASYDFAPATILNGDTLSGMEGDLINEIAKLECLKVTVNSSGGAGAVISSVQTNRVDIGSGGWLRTKARQKIVHLSTPLWSDAQAVVSTKGVTSENLEGHMVGSTSGNLWNDSMTKWLGDKFKIYQDDESLFNDLKAGRIDAAMQSAISAKYKLQQNPIEGAQVVNVKPNPNVPEFASVGQVMLPSSLDNEAFGKALDEDIEKLRADGTIKKILEKYGIDAAAGEPGAASEL
ncbi:ABC transporter substrate-binding protein [Paenarthrobacter sp. A20]|uniref:substrate-binding periplasmic protein n=1 Tax=Paenarthrobacter sp. A20 TaxID=2817891 RepID=UPI00209CDC5C|nr:ABC transporter substrate-binding protein [Paenarthrobacter sp. A20]MCP1415525.1 polar amino acid transport system substrate-binding protein [Paenarthrobacter sp. A20]